MILILLLKLSTLNSVVFYLTDIELGAEENLQLNQFEKEVMKSVVSRPTSNKLKQM